MVKKMGKLLRTSAVPITSSLMFLSVKDKTG